MFQKFKVQKTSAIFSAMLAVCSISTHLLANDIDPDIQMKRHRDLVKGRPIRSTLVVLGPSSNGKSTLVNMLLHTAGYATHLKSGKVLLDATDPMQPIYHQDIFRFDIQKPVDPISFADLELPDDLNDIPGITSFLPVLGPIPVLDFSEKQSEILFDTDLEASAEKVSGGTAHPHLYNLRAKVTKPVFDTTLIDAQGIKDSKRLAFFKAVVEKAPSDEIHAFLLVISAEQIADENFTPETFQYYKEIRLLLEQFDPGFTRVLLAVTHTGSQSFQSKLTVKTDPRRFVVEKFKKVTDINLSMSNVFFFENKYNCLSADATEDLYSCHNEQFVGNEQTRLAYKHREKNYKLNILESFNLLKTVSKIKPAFSRSDLLQGIEDEENRIAEEVEEVKAAADAKAKAEQEAADAKAAKEKADADARKKAEEEKEREEKLKNIRGAGYRLQDLL